MEPTTNNRLTDEQKTFIEETVDIASPHIIEQTAAALAKKFATPADLREMVTEVIKIVNEDAASRTDAVKQVQEAWQSEQERKQASFFAEMRQKLETVAPMQTVENLRMNVEDNRIHSESNLEGHRAEIDNLKSQVESLTRLVREQDETTTRHIKDIGANADSIGKSARVIQNTVNQLVSNDVKRQKQLDALAETAEQHHKKVTEDIDVLQDDMRRQSVTWIEFSKPLETIPARMLDLETKLLSALWLLNSWGGRFVLGTILTLFTLANRAG